MAAQQHLHSPALSDGIYNVTPQQTGICQGGPSQPRQDTLQHLASSKPPQENPFDDGDEKPPALPARRSSSFAESVPPPPPLHPAQPATYRRSKEHVTAYMLPLPLPRGPDGQLVDVPQRYMLYLPPAPDLLKPPADSDTKERKRDKWVRRWQAEVRKAKTHSGSVVSFSGLYCATVRGAVYCLALIQRSELTFLSRLPRKTLRELCFVHPAAEGTPASRRFELVKEEFRRNKHVAKRDFWIGAVVLPFAEGVDIAIPVGGGFSEVTLIWMIVTGKAWKTASGMLQRLVFNEGGGGGGGASVDVFNSDGRGTGAVADESVHRVENAHAHAHAHLDEDEHEDEENEETSAAHEKPEKRKTSRWKRSKAKKPPVETEFRPATSLDELSHYIQAACHARNPDVFPDVGQPGTEAEVLTSIGWAPEDRDSEDKEGDVAWQVRKTTEDLKVVVTKAAKTWDKFCVKYMQDPEKVLQNEEKARMKHLKSEQKQLEKKQKEQQKEQQKEKEKADEESQ